MPLATITLPFRLPGLNEYTRACRSHPIVGAQMKKKAMEQVMAYLPKDRFENVKEIFIIYTEPNRRRDIDNIMGFGAKVILDALVKNGNLPDDGQKYVSSLTQSVDRGSAGNEINIGVHYESN